ncbi:MAG: GGDEF domain-containing protein [Acidobacteria bacterium]|nr:GGDEF domain-containing protein [Acidobacteriota bacterium]
MKNHQPAPSVMIREPGLRNRAGTGMFPGGLAAGTNASPAGPTSGTRTQKSSRRASADRQQVMAGEQLLGMGRNLRILAVTLIVVLSAGMALLFYSQLRESTAVANVLGDADGLLGGFGFLMLLTVIYLVSKHWTTSHNQRRMIDQILEEEAVARALQQNPITDFHHPEVCRDILTQQASHAARLHAPLSLLELNISGLGKVSQNPGMQAKVGELIRQIKSLCRATDSVLRWTPDSFLLAFPEVTREELAAISERLRQDLERWIEEHYEEIGRPALQWRGASSTSLDSCGDILLETQRLLERESRLASRNSEGTQSLKKRDKGIALALELEICGEDQNKKFFEQTVVTKRVAADRFWCELRQDLVELSPMTVSAPDGAFCEQAVLAQWIQREDDRLAEIQFTKTPDRWVIRGEA